MKIVKPAVIETCKKCGSRRQVKAEIIGCDGCGKPIDLGDPDRETLQAGVFHRSEKEDTGRLYFCSWQCALAALSKVRTDSFISLPYLSYDHTVPGTRASDFWRIVKRGLKGKA